MASAYIELNQLKRKYEQLQYDYRMSKGVSIQQCIDVAEITLHNFFGFGPERNAKFEEEFKRLMYEVMEMAITEAEGNAKNTGNDIGYTKDMLDEGLRQAVGDKMIPFDERYAEGRLYERIREFGR